MKDKIRSIFDLCLGLLILIATVCAYFGHWDNLGEYCCISGITTGTIFTASFFYRRKSGKFFPEWIYINCSVATIIILIATIGLGLNLNGAFIFIHIIDPLLMFLYWAIFCEHESRIRTLPTVLVFPVVYTLLSGTILMITGDCPFPASLVLTGHTPVVTALLVIAVYALLLLVASVYYYGAWLKRRRLQASQGKI